MQETDSDLGDDLDGLDPDTDHQELLQPVEWPQLSCTSGGTYNSDADVRSTETEGSARLVSNSFQLTKFACMLMNVPMHSGRELMVKVKLPCKITSKMGCLRKI